MSRVRAGRIRVLHVDDDPDFAELSARFLEREDERFTVEIETSAKKGLDRLTDDRFDCIVSDYDMPKENGIEFLETVRKRDPDIPFILFTGKGGEEVASEAISAGVSDYLQKGANTERYELLSNRIITHVEQARTRRELEEREAHLRQAQAVADLGSWKLDLPTEELDWSAEVYRIFGVPDDESVSYKMVLDSIHPEDLPDVKTEWSAALTGAGFDLEFRIVTKNGETRWVRGVADIEDDAQGTPTSVFGVIQEITEFKEREQRLREERDRRDALFQNPSDPIIEIEYDDETPIIVATNETFTEVFGFDRERVLDRPVSEVLVPDEKALQTEHEEIRKQVLQGEPVDTTVFRRTQNGRRGFLLRVFPIDVPDGNRASYAIYTDVTENSADGHSSDIE